jgi:D-lyxose ketol-isomerase
MIIADRLELIRRNVFALPPFAGWVPEAFAARAVGAQHAILARAISPDGGVCVHVAQSGGCANPLGA